MKKTAQCVLEIVSIPIFNVTLKFCNWKSGTEQNHLQTKKCWKDFSLNENFEFDPTNEGLEMKVLYLILTSTKEVV